VDGSWFASQPSKNVQGGSMISDSVEIQENCSLTRSSILNGATIGRASKIENCLIGSNAVIGEECSLNGVIVDHDGNVPAGTSLRGGTWPPSD
jgi:ADP-glucose pyrophosphorylase